MNFISLVLGLISFMGLFAGFGLAKLTHYELGIGKRYFLVLRKALFLIICSVAIFESGFLVVSLLVLLLGLVIFLTRDFPELMYATLIFPLAISLSVDVFALVFFYGLVDSAIMVQNDKKLGLLGIFKKRFYFPLLLILLFFSLQLF